MTHDSGLIGSTIAALLVLALLFLRLRRLQRGRRLRLERLWLVPAIMLAVLAVALVQTAPRPDDWPWLAAAAAVGAGAGWLRGSMMAITIDPETHAMNMQASPAALIFVVALFAVRAGLRTALANAPEAWHFSAVRVADGLLLLAVGMICVQRLELWIRGRRLLTEARAAGAD